MLSCWGQYGVDKLRGLGMETEGRVGSGSRAGEVVVRSRHDEHIHMPSKLDRLALRILVLNWHFPQICDLQSIWKKGGVAISTFIKEGVIINKLA